MYRIRSQAGMGDILNPTAGTALNCGLFAGGVFKKECWCLEYPSLCSEADYVASRALADPSVYAALQAPPVVGAPTGAALTTPPASGEQAQAQVDAILAQQVSDWQAQNMGTMQQTQSGLDQFAADFQAATSGISWWLIGALGLGVFALVTVGGGSPRRYGR